MTDEERRKVRARLQYEAGFKRIFAVLAACWVAYYLWPGIAVIVRGLYIDVGSLVSRLAVAVMVLVLGYIFFFGVVP
jgi:hypothetical protein